MKTRASDCFCFDCIWCRMERPPGTLSHQIEVSDPSCPRHVVNWQRMRHGAICPSFPRLNYDDPTWQQLPLSNESPLPSWPAKHNNIPRIASMAAIIMPAGDLSIPHKSPQPHTKTNETTETLEVALPIRYLASPPSISSLWVVLLSFLF